MELFKRKIELAIFDLDGTLIESTSLWSDIDKRFFAARKMEVPPNYTHEISHLGLDKAAILTKEKYLPDEEVDDILDEWKKMSKIAYEEEIDIKPFSKELLELLKGLNVHIALATANSKELYEPCLKRLGIYDYFEYIVDVNSTKKGKTSSEIYDTISAKYHLTSDNVMVIEDLFEAIKTAYNANYLTIAVYDSHTTKDIDLTKSYSHYFSEDFSSLCDVIKRENNI